MPLLDQDLPARAQQGDENALAALIARMMPAIRKGAAVRRYFAESAHKGE